MAKESSSEGLITWERTTVAFMSDGAILTKKDVVFRPEAWETKGRRYSYGWQIAAKALPKDKLPGLLEREARFRAYYEARGYQEVLS